jgi:hypothetical protein
VRDLSVLFPKLLSTFLIIVLPPLLPAVSPEPSRAATINDETAADAGPYAERARPNPTPPRIRLAAGTVDDRSCPASGRFLAHDGVILDPDGRVWSARGINIYQGQVSAEAILVRFPGINMVRVAAKPVDYNPTVPDPFVTAMTRHGIVVEIEDHHADGSNARNALSGAALTAEERWYASLAATYRNNPYVWFGTANEPTGRARVIAQQEAGIYRAIRDAGNRNPIMLELFGGYTNAELPASDYAGMTNVIWDTHYYGWVPKYSMDQATVTSGLAAEIAEAQRVVSGEGKVPAIIGEYGVSTTGGPTADRNQSQVLAAIEASNASGTLAWVWQAGNSADSLTTPSGGLTPYGRRVQQFIARQAGNTRRAGRITDPAGPCASRDGTPSKGFQKDPHNG